MKRKLWSMVLCAAIVLSACPQPVFAAGDQASTEMSCTCEEKCTEDMINTDCPVCGDERANLSLCTGTESDVEQPETDEAVKNAQELIDALPSLADMENMSDDELQTATEQHTAAREAYELLTDEQKEQITGAEVLDEFAALMNDVVPLADAVSYRDYDNGSWSTKQVVEYTEITADSAPTTWETGWYVVTGDVTISSRVTVSGDVNLVLKDGTSLTVNGGIQCTETNSLTIYGQEEGTGALTAQNTNAGNAGIGGNSDEGSSSCGEITINGGVIASFGGKTVGSYGAAGIGGGSHRGNGGVITINGGVVEAVGSYSAAGIGGGSDGGNGGVITINGGVVTATAEASVGEPAGIGGGSGGAAGTITITGGLVTATGCGKGIGSGDSTADNSDPDALEKQGTIHISGGVVTANGIGTGAYGESIITSITDNAVVISTKANDNVPESINTANKEQWGGIVIEDGAGNVYGESVTITENCTLPDNVELDIGENKTVTISENVTLANNGTIINDGVIINSGTITNNAAIANNGTIDNSGEIFGNAGSSFTGSDPSGGSITYQISWDTDGDGTIDDTTYVSSGATPSHADGSKASTVDTVYTFTGWSPAVASATEPATYTAQFSSDVRSYTVSLPVSPEGYTISTDDATSLTYGSSFTFTVNLAEGYSETERFAVRSNGMVLAPNTSGSYSVIVQSDTEITVEGVEDITAPDGDIEIQQNSARKDIDEVSFELFFHQNADITITASDAGSGLKSIEYYRSEEILSAEEVSEITEWVTYTSSITETAADEEKFIYYVKLTDNAGNTACFASNGVTFDLAVPAISGVTDGASYYTTQTVNVKDISLDSVTVNGAPVTVMEGTAEATLAGNTDTVYTIVAKDKVGNETTVTVTMKMTGSLEENLGGITKDHATSADRETVQEYLDDLNGRLEDDKLTEAEKTILEGLASEAQDILDRLDQAEQAASTEAVGQTQGITTDNVTLADKGTLEQAKEDIEQAMDEFGGNYTDEEKTKLEGELSRIEDALDVIQRVENAETAIEVLPDEVSPDNTEAEEQISEAKEIYDTLTDYEKTLVPAETKEKLENLLADLRDYRIIKGSGRVWAKESSAGLTFTANGAFSKFAGIEVDDKAVDPGSYTAESGSTIIMLKTEYLETLAVGEHTLTVLYTDGEASGTFTIAEKASAPTEGNQDTTSPGTGDDSNIVLWFAVMLAAGTALTRTAFYSRKRKHDR